LKTSYAFKEKYLTKFDIADSYLMRCRRATLWRHTWRG